MEKPDAIVAFGFTKEGEANEHIAIEAKGYSHRWGVPIFTQNDVARYLSDVKQPVLIAEENERYLSTLGIVLAFKKVAQQHRWKRVFVIAVPPHVWRCSRDLRKMGFDVLDDRSYFKDAYRSSFWYNRKDPQLWVRGRIRWWSREIVLRLLPWNIYSKLTA